MLKQRIITAVIAVVTILLAVFAFPQWMTLLLLGALIVAGGWEWAGFVRSERRERYAAFALAMALALAMTWLVLDCDPGNVRYFSLAALAGWFVAFLTIPRFPVTFANPAIAVAGFWVLVPTFAALSWLYLGPDGPRRLMLFLAIVWSADIGAYFVGRRFGRVKLAPRVSPGKTWEGVGGGLAAVAAVAAAGAWLLGLPIAVLVPLALAVALISIVGDLTVSMFKRNAGLKDSGKLFPGHGGVLDRIDSVCAGAPVFVLALSYLA